MLHLDETIMNNYFYKINVIDSDTLIISFAGHNKIFGRLQSFEFVNFLNKNFKNIDKHFYIDKFVVSYHQGISGITNNIDETVEYLKNEIQKYKKIIFIGVSSGGYAAILFGSLLNITNVVAFMPQTILRNKQNVDEKYRDISKYINNTTKYYIYGDVSIQDVYDCHHISHCERISHHSNVFLERREKVDIKKMRDSGELFFILNSLVGSQYTNTQNYTNSLKQNTMRNRMNSVIKNI